MRKPRTAYLLLLPFLALMALVLWACGNVLAQSLGYVPAFGLTRLTFGYFAAALSRPEVLASIGVSLRIALISAVLAAGFGTLLCAALVGRGHTRGGFLTLVRLPILVPHTVAALFTVLVFSQTGLLARCAAALGLLTESSAFPQLLYTPGATGTILAYLWKEIPFVAYFSLALMASVSGTLGEAAQNLGASRARSFFTVTLPLSLPAILRAFLIIFLFAFGGYELPYLLGATLPKALPVYAYLSYMSPDLKQRPYAMAIFAIILLLSAAMAVLYLLLTRRLMKKLGGAA